MSSAGQRQSPPPAPPSTDPRSTSIASQKETRMSPVIDVHTHMLNNAWFDLLQKHGKPRYTVEEVKGGLRAIHLDGAPFMTPVPAMNGAPPRCMARNPP